MIIIKAGENKKGTMWQTFEKYKWEVESQADSQFSVIDAHDTQCKGLDEFEKVYSIREIFKPDFTVYLQKHSGTTQDNIISEQVLNKGGIETMKLV